MLYIKGVKCEQQEEMKNCILYPDTVYEVYCQDAWLDSDFGRTILQDIDGRDVSDRSRHVRDILLFDYRVLHTQIATGTKNLFLCKFFDPGDGVTYYNRLGRMGENCFKYLVQASLERDIYMTTTVYRGYPIDDPFPSGATVCFEDLGVTATDEVSWHNGMVDLMAAGLLEV